ncbi:MAG: hypothetical protein RL154_569 [Pseudomonadota bacterium]
MSYLLALDLGTGSARAIIFSAKLKQISVHGIEWTHLGEDGVSGAMNFDCIKGWEILCECIKNAIAKAQISALDIVAVSATSMREGIVVYDKFGKEIWAVANVDSRAGAQVAMLKKTFPDFEQKHYKTSGQTFALGALPRLLWLKENRSAIFANAAKMTMLSEWSLFKLCGEFSSEPSNAGTSGLFGLEKRTWEPELAKTLNVSKDFFPNCFESGTAIGKVAKEAASESGLAKDTLVVLGGGDVQLGCVGLGVIKKGQIAALGGTFWQQLANIDAGLTDPKTKLRVNPHAVAGLSQAEGITFFVGTMTRWFRDLFCEYEKALAKERGVDTYEILEEMASLAPVGANGILPIFSNAMNYAEWKHAAPSLLNLNLDAALCSKGAIFRSLQENAAIVSAINLENVENFAGTLSDSLVFAGGASNGKLWAQILSDTTKKRVVIPKVKEATALGCAMSAGVGAKLFASLEEAVELIEWEREVLPNAQNAKIYDEIKIKWQEAYAVQLKLADNGITQHMWKAPGV